MTVRARRARRTGIGLAAVCAALLTASCAAGQHASTAEETPAVEGVTGYVGDMQVHAAAVISPKNACYLPGSDAEVTLVIVNTGRDSDSLSGVTSPRFDSSVLLGNSDDLAAYTKTDTGTGSCAPAPSGSGPSATALPSGSTSGSAGGSSSGSAPAPGGGSASGLPQAKNSADIAAGHRLALGVRNTGTDTSGQMALLLRDLKGGPLFPGESIKMTFTFSNAGALTLTVPVLLSVAPNNATVGGPSGTLSE